MASEDVAVADGGRLAKLYEALRPFGGALALPLSQMWNAEVGMRNEDKIPPPFRIPHSTFRIQGDWVLLAREGPLPGAGDWTHEHADAANTRVSPDTLVKAPLGLLWFGGHSNEGVLPRHGHGPQPQALDGRLFIEGVDMLRAIDVYTGRLLWEAKVPGLGKAYDNLAHQPGANGGGANFVSTREALYVALADRCVLLDPATGARKGEYRLPALPGCGAAPVWSWLSAAGDVLLVGANPPAEAGKSASRPVAASSSKCLAALDRRTGRLLWAVAAKDAFRHNAVCAGGGRVYAIDRPALDAVSYLKGKKAVFGRLVCLDLATGKERWRSDTEVFGTWLSYSAQYDILVEAGRVTRDALVDEPKGMRAYRGADGRALWYKAEYAGPAMIHGDKVLREGGACLILTGEPYKLLDPITGKAVEWVWSRNYGCNTPMASENLLTFRSGAAGYYDLCGEGGTGNLGGFRSGCTNNLVVAGGVLCAPDYTRTCTCAYQNQTSLAVYHDPEAELWTFQGKAVEVTGPVRRVGVLLGAPGNRRAADGALWLEHPVAGGPSPRLAVKTDPPQPETFRKHSALVTGDEPWAFASGAQGLRSLTIPLNNAAERIYTVRLHFVEPDGLPAGRRVFDVALQGKEVLHGLDVSAAAGGPDRALVKEVRGVKAAKELRVTLTAAAGRTVLCGVEVLTEEW
jgi:outer membrane protein assembly factor BamB